MIEQKSCHLLDLLTTQSATRSRHFLTRVIGRRDDGAFDDFGDIDDNFDDEFD